MRAVVLRAAGGQLVCEATGVTSVYFVVEPNRRQLARIARLLDERLPPRAIDSVFALEDAGSAFERSLAAGKSGKVVLEMAREPA